MRVQGRVRLALVRVELLELLLRRRHPRVVQLEEVAQLHPREVPARARDTWCSTPLSLTCTSTCFKCSHNVVIVNVDQLVQGENHSASVQTGTPVRTLTLMCVRRYERAPLVFCVHTLARTVHSTQTFRAHLSAMPHAVTQIHTHTHTQTPHTHLKGFCESPCVCRLMLSLKTCLR